MEAYIGVIILFAGSYAPEDWAYCDGRTLSVQQYQALYSILGTKYGGNGSTEFSLPNLPAVKTTDGKRELKYIICLNGIYPANPY